MSHPHARRAETPQPLTPPEPDWAPDLQGRRPLPRVTISAFLSSEPELAAMEQVSGDRRLARAKVDIQSGGILAAAAQFARTPSSEVVIVEVEADSELFLAQIDALAEVCDSGTRVIVIGSHNDANLFRALRGRGVEDYLVKPVTPVALLDALTALYMGKVSGGDGLVYVFLGARGGAGSSTLSHHVAWSLAHQRGEETLLLDLDMGFGTAAIDFNCQPLQTISEALLAGERLDIQLLERLKTACGERLSLIAAPDNFDRTKHGAESCETLLQCVRASTDYTVVDLPPTWNNLGEGFILSADKIILTLTPDLAGLRNGKMLRESILRRRPNDPPPVVVLNQTGVPNREEVPDDKIEFMLGAKPDLTLGFTPGPFTRAANRGHTVFEEEGTGDISRTLEVFAAELAGLQVPDAPKAADNPKSGEKKSRRLRQTGRKGTLSRLLGGRKRGDVR